MATENDQTAGGLQHLDVEEIYKLCKNEEKKSSIFDLDKVKGKTAITIVGKRGAGKTWAAEQISDSEIKKGFFKHAVWVFLNAGYDEMSLRESISLQLSCPAIAVAEDGKTEAHEEEKKKLETEKKIERELKEIKFFEILILDDAEFKLGKNKEMLGEGRLKLKPGVLALLQLLLKHSDKVVLTRTRSMGDPNEVEIQLKPLSDPHLLLSLLQERVGQRVYKAIDQRIIQAFIRQPRFPAEIVLLAKALSCIDREVSSDTFPKERRDSKARMLVSVLKEASVFDVTQLLRSGYDLVPKSILIDCCRHGSHFIWDHGRIHYNELIAYWILEGYLLGDVGSVQKAYEKGHLVLMELVDCMVLKKFGGGYVVVDEIDEIWDDSDHCGSPGTSLLGLDDVFKNFTEFKWNGLGRITPAQDRMIKSLGTDQKGQKQKQRQKLSTLLLDGNSFIDYRRIFSKLMPREELQIVEPLKTKLESLKEESSYALKKELQNLVFFNLNPIIPLELLCALMNELRVLAVFNPNLESFTSFLMQELVVLVLRGCDFLKKVDHMIDVDLKRLTVLEISNASSLETIPDNFFEPMSRLRSLHLSELKVRKLPSSLYKLEELCWLILRGCSQIEKLGSLEKLENLLVLDISGASSLTRFTDKTFDHITKLQVLNLSHTNIEKLPKMCKLGALTHLSLVGCEFLTRLPKTVSLTSLQTLDLSGARKFNEFQERPFGDCVGPKILDLSDTLLENLPSKMNPRHLCLRQSKLKKLSCNKAFKDLEVLDLSGSKSLVEIVGEFNSLNSLRILNLSETGIKILPSLSDFSNLCQLLLSGCTALEKITDHSFEHMTRLQRLDLSETKISHLPCLSNLSNLSVLLLEKCTNLTAPLPLESLENLEELNLSGISLKKCGAGFLEQMTHLRTLDLSETELESLTTLKNHKNLCQLYLRGCRGLTEVPGLGFLTELEVLDLSETKVRELPSLKNFCNLRQLMLSDCQNLQEFLNFSVKNLPCRIFQKNLPYGISELSLLEHIELPKINPTSGEPNQCRWGISAWRAGKFREDNTPPVPPVSVSSTKFLQLLNDKSWGERRTKEFHFSVYQEQSQKGVVSFNGGHFVFRDIYFKSRHFSEFEMEHSLEICGFHCAPKDIDEKVITNAGYVFLNGNSFNMWSSKFGTSIFKAVKGCWIEHCAAMDCVFQTGAAKDDAELGNNLEILEVLNAVDLETIYRGDPQREIFLNLKNLCLYCCPNLSTLFASPKLPQNLEVLRIKFCDKLKTLFQGESSEPKLQKLKKLLLWELPELESIDCTLKSLETLEICGCSKLKLDETINSNVTDLETSKGRNLQSESFGKLKYLTVESCPMLVTLMSSPQPPQSLETLKIKYCVQLKTLFENSTSGVYKLQNLRTLHLHQLPKLETIGCEIPSLKDQNIKQCPNIILESGKGSY